MREYREKSAKIGDKRISCYACSFITKAKKIGAPSREFLNKIKNSAKVTDYLPKEIDVLNQYWGEINEHIDIGFTVIAPPSKNNKVNQILNLLNIGNIKDVISWPSESYSMSASNIAEERDEEINKVSKSWTVPNHIKGCTHFLFVDDTLTQGRTADAVKNAIMGVVGNDITYKVLTVMQTENETSFRKHFSILPVILDYNNDGETKESYEDDK